MTPIDRETELARIASATRAELELLSPAQVCALLDVTHDWLIHQVQHNHFPVVRLGHRTLRFRPGDISAWIANPPIKQRKKRA